MSSAAEVVQVAQGWVGKEFNPGVGAQCAQFVRRCFLSAGIDLPNASHPTDGHLIPDEPLGPAYANSFAGDEVGRKVAFGDLRPGDVVMFRNTYGNWPTGVITHVGIYVGDGQMVHRPTSSRPVERANITAGFWRDLFQEARRPKQFAAGETPKNPKVLVKVFAHEGGHRLVLGTDLKAGTYDVVATTQQFEVEVA